MSQGFTAESVVISSKNVRRIIGFDSRCSLPPTLPSQSASVGGSSDGSLAVRLSSLALPVIFLCRFSGMRRLVVAELLGIIVKPSGFILRHGTPPGVVRNIL